MSIQFQSLFTIEVLHDYYDKHARRCEDFDIIPTEDCLSLMKNMVILHKNHNNKLLTVINASKETNSAPPPDFRFSPFLDFRRELVLRYYMVPRNPNFSNFTAIARGQSGRSGFYFSNLSKNKVGSTLALANNIASFDLNKSYAPGHLVKGADNNFYESVRSSDGTAESKDVNNKSYWQKAAANNPYVNSSDEVTISGGNYHYKLKNPASNIIIRIFDLNRTDSNIAYDHLVETVEKSFTQNQDAVTVDLSKRKPGKYRIVVNNEGDNWVYVDPEAIMRNIFGIIEIHHFEKVPADFQLLTAPRFIKVPEPVFTIWFKNRSVTWKYISQNGDIGVTDSAATPRVFVPNSGLAVSSEEPIALSETPVATLTATKTASGRQIKNLRNPDIANLVFERDGNTGFFSTSVYLKIDT